MLSHISPSSSKKPPETKRVENWQRRGPGAGRPRTCAVISTVGTHETGSRPGNAVGGKMSSPRRSAIESIGSLSSRSNQPRITKFPEGSPTQKTSSGWRCNDTRFIASGGNPSPPLMWTHSSIGGRLGATLSTRVSDLAANVWSVKAPIACSIGLPSLRIDPATVANRLPFLTMVVSRSTGPTDPGARKCAEIVAMSGRSHAVCIALATIARR